MRLEFAAYDAMPDTPGSGPYPAAKLVDPGFADHVIYRPANLKALGSRKLGVLVWGNGGCSADGASARLHLEEIASHGYLVIAPGRVLSGPGAPPRTKSPGAPGALGALGVDTTTAQVAAGIDWALAENARPASPLYRRIDPQMVAVSGHSCGGLQALQIAGDPRIRAVIIHNSGIFADGTNPIRGITVDKSLLQTLHTPILYIMGGPTDIAWPNGNDDYRRIDKVPAVLVSLGVGHGGTFHQPNGGRVTQVDVAWLDWQLRHDNAAARWFSGASCRLCTNSEWTVLKKKID
ncbi:hypothetical protein GCM10009087_05650 [Sphingomonas oligophenolica]